MTQPLPLADELAAVFARMTGLLPTPQTVRTALELVTSLAAEVLPETAGAGVSLLDAEGRRTTAAATDTVVERADALQYELGEGPCLTAWEQHSTVRVDDITADTRWPTWQAAVSGTGLRSALSAPLVAGGAGLGAIKVYSTSVAVFTPRDEHVMRMFAAQAATLVRDVRAAERARQVSGELRSTVRQRDVVQLAKGVLMNRERVSEDDALLLLIALARGQRTTMYAAAEGVIRSTPRRRH
ncbi:GAF and ANTAR domain-containing protein [Georgenia sp. H159]|uniref:GAF and ANTAR domain-containing protein n=1 Tax=Georgenia sp. H159 TaxID=3076115 RepID=UPI002D7681D6|nr:GAF and ANTAR domain-containing protein [Georgenia sp. H159]